MAHTEGDWFVQGDKYLTIQSRHTGDGIKTYPTIATVNTTFIDPNECLSNGKLMAAAPKLLKALKRFQQEWVVNGNPIQRANNFSIEEQINEAIKEATE